MNIKIKLLPWFSLISLVPITTVAACSNSFVSKFGDQAIENTKNYFAAQQNWSSLVQAGFVSADQIKVLNPAQNFGFETKIKYLSVNDQIGNLTIGFELFKGSQKLHSEAFIGGFKTNHEAKNDFLTNPFQYFNTSNPNLLFKQIDVKEDQSEQDPQLIVDQVLNNDKSIDELKKYVAINYDANNPNTILKKNLASDEKLIITSIKTISNYDIQSQILVKLRIINSKKEMETSELSLLIKGFKLNSIEKQLNNQFLSSYANNYFSTIDSPINLKINQNYLDQKASEIKTGLDLQKLFKLNDPIITINNFLEIKDLKLKITLKTIVENSQDDSEGSLRANFDFTLEGMDESIKLENQEIILFGFKIN